MTTKMFVVLSSVVLIIANADSVYGAWHCTSSDQCIGGAATVCENSICSCPRGQIMNNNGTVCLDAGLYILSACVESHQCKDLVTGYECHQETGSCLCVQGYHYKSGRCWPSVVFGQSCTFNEQCDGGLLSLSLACKEGKCSCASGYYNRQRGECRKAATKIGDACIVNDDCQIEGESDVRCPEFTCQKKSKSLITKRSVIQSSLSVSFDESPNLNDIGLKMAIAINEMAVDEVETTTVLGEKCDTDEECAGATYSECSAYGYCICKAGYYPKSDLSICLAELGMTAVSGIHCGGSSSKLVDGICDCPIGFFYAVGNRDCMKPTRRFGESCKNDASCYTFGAEGRCVKVGDLTQCHCSEMAVEDEERQICKVAGGLGDICQKDNDCLESMACTNKTCGCRDGDFPADSGLLCYKGNLGIGETCQLNQQCQNVLNASCISSKCTCDSGFFANATTCVLGINGTCSHEDDCVVENSFCDINGTIPVCKCLEKFVNHSPKTCHKVATKLGEPCEVDEQCWAKLGGSTASICQSGKCSCVDLHHERMGQCFKTIKLGELCSRTPECFTENKIERTECRNAICHCELQYKESLTSQECNTASIMGKTVVLEILVTFIAFLILR